jgi:hypothetical protein
MYPIWKRGQEQVIELIGNIKEKFLKRKSSMFIKRSSRIKIKISTISYL